MKKEVIGKSSVVWHTCDNFNETRTAQHCYKSSQRHDTMGRYTGEWHLGNSALCNKRTGVSEDGDSFLDITQIIPDELKRNFACKTCLSIYDKLPNF